VRQFVATGLWRGELARRFPASQSLRYLVPPLMVVGVTVGAILGVVGLGMTGSPGGWLTLAFIVPAVYLLFVVVAAVPVIRTDGGRSALWFLVVLPCIHFGWGIGFILGSLTLTRNITEHTGR
jgi:hypothetical protein